jgi:hypothetical protein
MVAPTQAAWATAISGYIVLSTAIDVSLYTPLIAISTGDILMGAVYGDRVHRWRRLENPDGISVARIPRAIGPMFLSNLVIAKYAGIFTILFYTVCPALLALSSRAYEEEELATDYVLFVAVFVALLVLRPALLSAAVLVGIV